MTDTTTFRRSSTRYYFGDQDMDLIFQWALGMAKTGGLDAGELFFVASQIADGDPRSWSAEFETYGDAQQALADRWSTRQRRSAAEARMKAYAAYRWAWQFSTPSEGDRFTALIRKYEAAFAQSVREHELPVEFLDIPFDTSAIPALRLSGHVGAPTLLIIGGGDTGREDLFHLIGLGVWQCGYTTVMVDLPGQGSTPLRGLHFSTETERPVSAIVDFLIASYGQDPRRLAAIGFSGGGYAVCRALGFEHRIAAGAASTPIGEMTAVLPPAVIRALAKRGAMQSNIQIHLWRAGLATVDAFADLLREWSADPARVRCPFLSIAGMGEAPSLLAEARRWHEALTVSEKRFLVLDAESGADAHCQVNNPTRLRQEVCAWLDARFA